MGVLIEGYYDPDYVTVEAWAADSDYQQVVDDGNLTWVDEWGNQVDIESAFVLAHEAAQDLTLWAREQIATGNDTPRMRQIAED